MSRKTVRQTMAEAPLPPPRLTLSADCVRVLDRYELTAERDNRNVRRGFVVEDSDGLQVARLTPGIDAADLSALLAHSERRFQDGCALGRAALQRELRQLIGKEES